MLSTATELILFKTTNVLNSKPCERSSPSKIHTPHSLFSKYILIFLTGEETFSHIGQQKVGTEAGIAHFQSLPQEYSNFAYICLKNKQVQQFNITQLSSFLTQIAITTLLEITTGTPLTSK